MDFIRDQFGRVYAPNTRETVRRQVLHQFVQGNIAEYNPFEPNLPTNSPRTHYAITEAALASIHSFGTPAWTGAVDAFLTEHGALAEKYARKREQHMVPVQLPAGKQLTLSPGKHNEVQKAIIEDFAPRFAPGAKLLYLGDTAQKNLFADAKTLATIKISITEHDKLPDVVLYDRVRNWLFLIEAVTSHGPMTPKRVVELEEMLGDCAAARVYVSAFPDFAEFRKHMKVIAWDTEVWLANTPDHMIHYNGDRFLGPKEQH